MMRRLGAKSKWVMGISWMCTLLVIVSLMVIGNGVIQAQTCTKKANVDIELDGNIGDMPICMVYTEAGLRKIGTGKYKMNYFYMLAADEIEITGEWKPIGTKENPFTGYLDGEGCMIKGLTGSEGKTLFGYAKKARIYNITLCASKGNTNTQMMNENIICAMPSACSIYDIDSVPEDKGNSQNKAVKIETSVPIETQMIDGEKWYLLKNEAQLRALGSGQYDLDKNYRQVANIQVATKEWQPIGSNKTPFTGKFDGNGFEIKGVTMADPNASFAAFFGATENAVICNITLRDYDVTRAGSNRKLNVIRGGIVIFPKGDKGQVANCKIIKKYEDKKEKSYSN